MSLRDKLGLNGPTLYLMDGSAFVFRSFYAFRDMTRSDGFPTNALYITTRLLLKLVREERPAHFAFVLDGKGPNFRHRLFPAYKANRSATPEDLVRQIEPITRVIRLLGLPLLISDQVEADDCIASLACWNGPRAVGASLPSLQVPSLARLIDRCDLTSITRMPVSGTITTKSASPAT